MEAEGVETGLHPWSALLALLPWTYVLLIHTPCGSHERLGKRIWRQFRVNFIGFCLTAAVMRYWYFCPYQTLWFAPVGLGVFQFVQFLLSGCWMPAVRMLTRHVEFIGEILIPQITLFAVNQLLLNRNLSWETFGALAVATVFSLEVTHHLIGWQRIFLASALAWTPILFLLYAADNTLTVSELVWLLVLSFSGCLLQNFAAKLLTRSKVDFKVELLRIWFLLLVGFWLMEPFITNCANGAGDAHWYALVLADFIRQFKAGVFPIFVGQSEFAFSGNIFPGRFSPYFQYFGVALDAATGHTLNVFAIQHLTVILSAIGGLFSAYLCMGKLAPQRRWVAAMFAALYVGSPAILASIYSMDMYMTFMTVPWLPLMVYGVVRSYKQNDRMSYVWLIAPTALLWYAHAPIAMWSTFFVVGSQIVRMALQWRGFGRELAFCSTCVVIFEILTIFPFVSAYYADPATGTFNAKDAADLMASSFRQAWLPVSKLANGLSDQQLGYGLTVILLMALLAASSRRASLRGRLLTFSAVSILILISPLRFFWEILPQTIANITDHAPGQRLYPLLAAICVFAGVLSLDWLKRATPLLRRSLIAALILSTMWSVFGVNRFLQRGHATTLNPHATSLRLRSENITLSRYSYDMFPARPKYFQNGVMDPLVNNHLLDANAHLNPPVQRMRPLVKASYFVLSGTVKPGTNELELSPPLVINPGRRYLVRFWFYDKLDYTGVLSMRGHTLAREYILPVNGEEASFGPGQKQRKFVTLWTSDTQPEIVRMRYLSRSAKNAPEDFVNFAYVTVREIVPAQRLINVESLVPYRATVRADQNAWLETVRMYSPGYAATVNGQSVDVRKSPQGMVMVPVPAGKSRVELTFTGPPALRIAFWTAAVAWGSLLFLLLPWGEFIGWARSYLSPFPKPQSILW